MQRLPCLNLASINFPFNFYRFFFINKLVTRYICRALFILEVTLKQNIFSLVSHTELSKHLKLSFILHIYRMKKAKYGK